MVINVEKNWQDLTNQVVGILDQTDSNSYLNLMRLLESDIIVPGQVETTRGKMVNQHYLGFKRAPAAKGNHHAYEGGLVQHYLEMWKLGRTLLQQNPELVNHHVNEQRVLKAVINHDIHKAFMTYLLASENPWQTEYEKKRGGGNLLTETGQSLSILMTAGVRVDDEQMNALYWAEGGFAEEQPKARSVLAVLCYLLDEFSGNCLGRADNGKWLDVLQQ